MACHVVLLSLMGKGADDLVLLSLMDNGAEDLVLLPSRVVPYRTCLGAPALGGARLWLEMLLRVAGDVAWGVVAA